MELRQQLANDSIECHPARYHDLEESDALTMADGLISKGWTTRGAMQRRIEILETMLALSGEPIEDIQTGAST